MNSNNIIGGLKRRHIWDALILIAFITLTVTMSIKLNRLNNTINSTNQAKLTISNFEQCQSLINTLVIDEWKASGYALYVMQPKNYKKTY